MNKRYSYSSIFRFLYIIAGSFIFTGNLIAQPGKGFSDTCSKELINTIETVAQKNIDEAITLCLDNIEKTNPRCKVELYGILADKYDTKLMPEKVLPTLKTGLALAKKTEYYQQCKQLNLQLFTFFLEQGDKEAAKNHLDSAAFYLNLYSTINEDDGYLSHKANWFEDSQQYDSSALYLKKSLQLLENKKDTAEAHIILHNLGNLYSSQSNFKEAIIYLLKSIQYKDAIGDKINMPGTMILLSNCYNQLEQYKTAYGYILKAKTLSAITGNQDYLYYSYFLLAKNISNYSPNSTLGILYADSAILIANQSNDKFRIAHAKTIKVSLLLKYNPQSPLIEKLGLESHAAFKEMGLKFYTCDIGFNLGNYYFLQKNDAKAEKYLKETLLLANETSTFYLASGSHNMLSTIYERKGDYKNALFHHQKFYQLKDSLEGGKLKSELAELEKKYSLEKKEIEIVKLNKETEVKDIKLKQSKARQNYFIILSLLLGSFIITGLWAYKKLRDNKNVLAAKNIELDSINQVKNRLFSIIAHDVKGLALPFQRASRILGHYIKKQDFNETMVVAKELEVNSENLSNLLDNLLQWSLEQMNGYTPKPELLLLKKEIEQIMTSYAGHATYKHSNLTQDIPEDLSVETDKGAFHVVFRNLIANAIKYTEHGVINIKAEKQGKEIICTVKDSGIGMDAQIISKLFSIGSDKIVNGTAGEKGSGLGLVLVKKFLELNGGSIKVMSKINEGTVFTIALPA